MAPIEPQPEVREASVVLVLDRAAEKGGFLVVDLEENASNKDEPYKLAYREERRVPAGLEGLVVKECPAHLRPSRPVHVVVSAKAGTGLAPGAWESVVRPLLDLLQGLEGTGSASGFEVHLTQNEDSVKEFARSMRGSGGQPTVILLSGDGGTSDLLNSRNRNSPSPTVAILPFGTGNALFHSLHKPLYSPEEPSPLVHGLRTFWKGTPSPLPAFSARFPPGSKLARAGDDPDVWEDVDELVGAVVFSHGFHASLIWESDTPRYREHGAARFGMVAAELLRESHAYEVEVSVRGPGEDGFRALQRVDGEEGEDGDVKTVGYILVAMVSNLEHMFAISPGSAPLDGKMRAVHFAAVGGPRTMEIMKAAYDGGKHVEMKDVGYEEVDGLEISSLEDAARWRKVCVDGTIVEVPKGGKVSLEKAPSSVHVLTQ